MSLLNFVKLLNVTKSKSQSSKHHTIEIKKLAKRGKSGGARVITFTYLIDEKDGVVILLLLYDKADASSIKINVVRALLCQYPYDRDTWGPAFESYPSSEVTISNPFVAL